MLPWGFPRAEHVIKECAGKQLLCTCCETQSCAWVSKPHCFGVSNPLLYMSWWSSPVSEYTFGCCRQRFSQPGTVCISPMPAGRSTSMLTLQDPFWTASPCSGKSCLGLPSSIASSVFPSPRAARCTVVQQLQGILSVCGLACLLTKTE